jgi:hypothetical protein
MTPQERVENTPQTKPKSKCTHAIRSQSRDHIVAKIAEMKTPCSSRKQLQQRAPLNCLCVVVSNRSGAQREHVLQFEKYYAWRTLQLRGILSVYKLPTKSKTHGDLSQ